MHFTISCNLQAGCPYFPGAYHYSGFNIYNKDNKHANVYGTDEANAKLGDRDMFAVGLENSESIAVAV